jgi:hypothetical protein
VSYRDPTPAGAPKRRGLFGGAPAGAASVAMPGVLRSFGIGFLAVVSSPVVLAVAFLAVFVEWLGAIVLGYPGPSVPFVNALAIPPVGTNFDASLANTLFGFQGGVVGVFGLGLVRALVLALLVGAIVDILESGSANHWSLVRGLRGFPTTLAVTNISVAILAVGSFLQPLVGAQFSLFLVIGILVAAVYLFVYAPVIAVAERRGMPDAIRRSIKVARTPGGGGLLYAVIYVVPSLLLQIPIPRPGFLLGVNPTIGAWLQMLLAAIWHAGFLAVFAYRYLIAAAQLREEEAATQTTATRKGSAEGSAKAGGTAKSANRKRRR